MSRKPPSSPVRYAVIGLGHIAQVAVLPAFANATENSVLTALVSDDDEKLAALQRRYDVPLTFNYQDLDDCLEEVDAVYIALPNSMHAEFTVRAAEAGVHVLCEKPMAVTVEECERMLAATREHDVRLMIAYRLHFEHVNLKAVELVRDGAIGEAETVQLDVLHARAAGRYPHATRDGWRHALRHWRVLHQCGEIPVQV